MDLLAERIATAGAAEFSAEFEELVQVRLESKLAPSDKCKRLEPARLGK